MPNVKTVSSSGAPGGSAAAVVLGGIGGLGALGGLGQALGADSGNSKHGRRPSNQLGDTLGAAVGGGALGSVVGGLAGVAGGSLLGGAFEDDKADKKKFKKNQRGRDGSFTSEVTETAYRPASRQHEERYGQARVSHTEYPSGGHRDEYQRYEQDGRGGHTGYGFQQSSEVYNTNDGGYTQRTERIHEHPGGHWQSEVQEQHVDPYGRQSQHEEKKHGYKKGKDSDSDSDSDDDSDGSDGKKGRKRMEKEQEKMEKMQERAQRQNVRSERQEERTERQEERKERQEKREQGRGGGRRMSGPKSPRHERKHSR